jgi:hypothetical protein
MGRLEPPFSGHEETPAEAICIIAVPAPFVFSMTIERALNKPILNDRVALQGRQRA